jgi:hypothetical protein
MVEMELIDPPVLPQPPPLTKFDRERLAFARLKAELLKDYRGQYVAIHEEKVVGSGNKILDVALEAYRKFGYQAIYVDLVTDDVVRPVRLPSPREIPQ